MILLTGRTTSQAEISVKGKNREEYKEKVAVAYLSKKDMEKLGLKNGENVKLASDTGFVVVKALESEEVLEGEIVMPPSPWLNRLIKPELGEGGILINRNLKVLAEKTVEKITDMDSLW